MKAAGGEGIEVVRIEVAQPGCVFLPGSHTSPGRKNVSPNMTAQTEFSVTTASSARAVGKSTTGLTAGVLRVSAQASPPFSQGYLCSVG